MARVSGAGGQRWWPLCCGRSCPSCRCVLARPASCPVGLWERGPVFCSRFGPISTFLSGVHLMSVTPQARQRVLLPHPGTFGLFPVRASYDRALSAFRPAPSPSPSPGASPVGGRLREHMLAEGLGGCAQRYSRQLPRALCQRRPPRAFLPALPDCVLADWSVWNGLVVVLCVSDGRTGRLSVLVRELLPLLLPVFFLLSAQSQQLPWGQRGCCLGLWGPPLPTRVLPCAADAAVSASLLPALPSHVAAVAGSWISWR